MPLPPALAGMPAVTLTDAAAVRLDAVSFFLLAFLLCAWAVKGLWNAAAQDFAALPRLTYRRAVGATALWGLLFLLVLTMISGARELLTPGAWEKDGLTYTLAGETADPRFADADVTAADRRAALAALYAGWRNVADSGGGWDAVPADLLVPPARAPRRYGTVDREPDAVGTVLAFEPAVYTGNEGGADPFVLFVGGAVHQLPRDVLETLLMERAAGDGG